VEHAGGDGNCSVTVIEKVLHALADFLFFGWGPQHNWPFEYSGGRPLAQLIFSPQQFDNKTHGELAASSLASDIVVDVGLQTEFDNLRDPGYSGYISVRGSSVLSVRAL